MPPVRGPTAYRYWQCREYDNRLLSKLQVKSPPPEEGGPTQEFARIFDTLSPQAQNEIIAEMLKRKRQEQ